MALTITMESKPAKPAATMIEDGEGASPGPAGTREGHVTGGFFHLIA